MQNIILLDNELANQIAAGEVIERPASVVKELVENSIDARATNIAIYISEGGRKEIVVIDDGHGIKSDQLKLAFSRHATSKLKSSFDLFRIRSLGFRGEALPSIASVSKVVIETATAGAQGVKAELINEQFIATPAAANVGTKITVSELFYNTPARLKYLKRDYTENAVTLDVVTRIALANPHISFSIYFDDKLRFSTTGRNDLKETIMNIYGLVQVKNILPIKIVTNDFTVTGFLGNTNLVRANRYGMITNLNGRNVYMPKVASAISEAYHGFIAPTRFPFVVLNFDVEPELVDVNVHPTKKEVRFSKEDDLRTALLLEIPKALRREDFIGQTTLIDVQKQKGFTFPEVSDDENPEQLVFTFHEDDTNHSNLVISERIVNDEERIDNTLVAQSVSTDVRAIASIHQTYIIAETLAGGFYLIDQHAAHERINYERFQKVLNEKLVTRPLLIPELFTFAQSEIARFTPETLKALRDVGLEVELFGKNTLRVISVPNYTGEYSENIYISNILEEVSQERTLNVARLRTNAIATMACKASIKAKHRLSILEMQHIIDTLLKCENPYTCPHGRPTIVKFSSYELEKMFKRTGL